MAPGIVDTGMQEIIRRTPAERFPEVGKFRQRKREAAFNRPEFVAREILAIAFDPAHRPDDVEVVLPLESEVG